MNTFYRLSCGVAGLGIFLFVAVAHATTITATPDQNTVTDNQAVQVTVLLDTQSISANTVQAEVTFPAALFSLAKINDGSSVVSLWITSPHESAPGVIDLAGVMPGGFTGSDGSLFSFTLTPVANGTGTIGMASGTVLANDGLGSPLPVTLSATAMNVDIPGGASTTMTVAPLVDYAAPNPFTPEIAHDSNIFDGKYFLVFSATDSGSGIDHYEVLEVPKGTSQQPFSMWRVATSPYLLEDQTLSSDIYVRAVNNAGNFIIVKVPAQHSAGLWTITKEFAIALAVGLFVIAIAWFFTRGRRLKDR